MNSETVLSAFQERFRGNVKVLIIDDDPQIHDLLTADIFTSPLFSFTSALTIKEATTLYPQQGWHAWILDLSLDNRADGTVLLKRMPPFPYVVGLSGLRSMEMASKAIAQGARSVFDKDPVRFFSNDGFYNEFCNVATLGFLLKGGPCDSLRVFQPLHGTLITSPDAWADLVSVSPRHLHRLCELHCGTPPKRALALYNAIYFALRGLELPSCLGDVTSNENTRLSTERDHYLEAMEYLMSRPQGDVR